MFHNFRECLADYAPYADRIAPALPIFGAAQPSIAAPQPVFAISRPISMPEQRSGEG